jgi:hypothetical protein
LAVVLQLVAAGVTAETFWTMWASSALISNRVSARDLRLVNGTRPWVRRGCGAQHACGLLAGAVDGGAQVGPVDLLVGVQGQLEEHVAPRLVVVAALVHLLQLLEGPVGRAGVVLRGADLAVGPQTPAPGAITPRQLALEEDIAVELRVVGQ